MYWTPFRFIKTAMHTWMHEQGAIWALNHSASGSVTLSRRFYSYENRYGVKTMKNDEDWVCFDCRERGTWLGLVVLRLGHRKCENELREIKSISPANINAISNKSNWTQCIVHVDRYRHLVDSICAEWRCASAWAFDYECDCDLPFNTINVHVYTMYR